MGPDDALRLADWVGGLFAEITPQQVAFLSDEFAAFDVAVVEQEVTRYRRHYEVLNVANLLRRVADEQSKRGVHGAPRGEREQVEAQWKQDEAALSSLTDAELRRHKDAILDENPDLRSFLGNKDPRESLVLRSLIVEHRLRHDAAPR
jgi:hypothetical protein